MEEAQAVNFTPQSKALFPTDRPQGTPEELSALKMDLRDWGSCAPQSPTQKGCPLYSECPIPKNRDRVGGKIGPELIGVNVILSPVEGGAGGGQIMPCYDMLYRGLKNRRENARKSGEVIRIMGVAGDDVTIREMTTRALHKTRSEGLDKNCEGCAKGDCHLREDHVKVHNLKDIRFARPAERFGNLALSNQMAQDMLEEMEKENDRAMLQAHAKVSKETKDAKLTAKG